MLNKIDKEIDEFSDNIKEVKGCDDMLTYMNSDIYASIKLLMFASKSFSLYSRILLFFVIAFTGLLIMSSISMGGLNTELLIINIVFFFLTILFVFQCKKVLISSIEASKKTMQESEQ